MKVNKKFSVSTIFTLLLIVILAFATTGCQKQPWTTPTPWNVGIVGDVDNAKNSCHGTVVEGENGYLFCQTDTKYNVGIVGDPERADAECPGLLVIGTAGYYECWIESPTP